MAKFVIFLLVLIVAWITLVSTYDIDKDPGGPLFMLGASLFVLVVPFIVLIGFGWLLWSFWHKN